MGRSAASRPLLQPTLPRSRTVLLLVDFINPLQFDGAEALAPPALQAAAAAAALKKTLAARGVRAIYVNDNFGHWQSDFKALLAGCRRQGGAAAKLARLLAPGPDDLTVLKPRHSAFLATPLDLLLTQMQTRELVICGLATDLCVMFSAMDAFVRGYRLWLPEDCTAAESPAAKEAALQWMACALKARRRASL
ncbi:cysteine hydrolase family protein [Roseateles violae]|uniref:Isochorismatase family cysteine hydrolase n=1 Tax=Roseateles violae TaxID=3058042 RepID=A0ABT8DXQ6_9BURK|nr:isochorismatase family cysteine hydrolase [Pelomonas sp. PFR6]MDN3921541.1 isochorismatase family cysteine hydrolase [Pelomonas sp. PFR6]